MSRNRAQALLGAWQTIVGEEQAPVPTNLYHGPWGGHRRRGSFGGDPRGFGGDGAGYGYALPQMAPPPGAYNVPFQPRNLLVDQPGPVQATRIILPMSSTSLIQPNVSAQITGRPQQVAFRPERIIVQNAEDWVINDIKVGNRSQFSQGGDIPGITFGSTTIDGFVEFQTVQLAMDFQIVTTNVGTSEAGEQFICSVLGTAAV